MKTVNKIAGTFLALAISLGSAQADVIDIVGDKDALGQGGLVDGGFVNTGAFDNRSGSEAAATDGSQNTDRSTGTFGMSLNFQDYFHSFGAIGSNITSIIWEIGIGGMQSNDNNVATKTFGEDGLFIDGILVANIFEPIEQGATGYNVFSFSLSSSFFSLFADGAVTMRIDSNSSGGTMPGQGASPIWYDYSELTITTAVPEPGTLALLGIGLFGMGLARRKKKV